MAYSIEKKEIIDYPAEILNDYIVIVYEYIDNLNFTLDPKECVENYHEYISIVKSKFINEGWEGDGNIELIWIPPFMMKDDEYQTIYFTGTKGFIVWHVKQESDGISFLLVPEIVNKQMNL